jgi:hypothetical protein
MRLEENQWVRLQFLSRVIHKECQYLQETDQRLFTEPFTLQSIQQIERDPVLAERLDAFVSRFGRLQDNLGDKLLPQLLSAMAEPIGAVMENLDRAEKLGWLASADTWIEIRKLRNQMVHEYIEDAAILIDALQSGHAYVPVLISAAASLIAQIDKLTSP